MNISDIKATAQPSSPDKKGYNFGTFQGVFMPSILTILGVVMYLRLGWVLGNLGLIETILTVTLATSITFLTALSVSELATNMKIGGGGAYYIISRSLGLEAGAAIGLPLFFAQALGVSFYIAGFSESLLDVFPQFSPVLTGTVILVLLTLLAYFSADLALKFQYLIFTLIFVSLYSFFTGKYSPDAQEIIQAAVPVKQSFWVVFAVFFPAVTGIEAGLSMSGDLKNPEKSLPRGTLTAILVSYLVYLAIPLYLTLYHVPEDKLLTNFFIMKDLAKWGNLVLYGLWGAALSSALGALLGAPRTLQALAKDRVIPRWIGKGFGRKNDPRIATAFSFGIALVGILFGNFNAIASLLTMFFLTSYGLLNLSAALEGIIGNPSWRPKFRVHWSLPLTGALGCLVVMFMISPGATFLAAFISGGVYYLVKRRQLNAYWGDMRHGIWMMMIRYALYKLDDKPPHAKTWRPNILVLSGSPEKRWYLIALADAISHGKGFLTVAVVLPQKSTEPERISQMQNSIRGYLDERSVPAMVKIIEAENVYDGAQELVNSYGFGALVPNTVLLGDVEESTDFTLYVNLIMTIYKSRSNLVIVREDTTGDHIHSWQNTQQIDLWFRRVGENSGLILALAYLLKTSPEWAGSKLFIKTIVGNQEEKVEQLKHFKSFVEKENIEAEIDIVIKDQSDIFALMRESSKDARFVFIGMKPPQPEETIEQYTEYYTNLIKNTTGFPALGMVLTSEKIDFDAIFQLRENQ